MQEQCDFFYCPKIQTLDWLWCQNGCQDGGATRGQLDPWALRVFPAVPLLTDHCCPQPEIKESCQLKCVCVYECVCIWWGRVAAQKEIHVQPHVHLKTDETISDFLRFLHIEKLIQDTDTPPQIQKVKQKLFFLDFLVLFLVCFTCCFHKSLHCICNL